MFRAWHALGFKSCGVVFGHLLLCVSVVGWSRWQEGVMEREQGGGCGGAAPPGNIHVEMMKSNKSDET